MDELCFKVGDYITEKRLNGKDTKLSLESLNIERKCLANDVMELKHISDILIEQVKEKDNR